MSDKATRTRARLREAALDLYEERGYDATTTAQIAVRAGLTERTYFRYFADKREVLFDGEAELIQVMTDAVRATPDGTDPVGLVLDAYLAAIPLMVAGRPIAQRRATVVLASPILQERSQAKAVALTHALVDALVERGVAEPTARLASRVGATIFDDAHQSWEGTSGEQLAGLIEQSAKDLRALL